MSEFESLRKCVGDLVNYIPQHIEIRRPLNSKLVGINMRAEGYLVDTINAHWSLICAAAAERARIDLREEAARQAEMSRQVLEGR